MRILKNTILLFIIWQGKSERSDWFILNWSGFRHTDLFIAAVCVLFLIKLRWPKNISIYETVISCAFFVFESRQIQNKHGPSECHIINYLLT